MIRVARERVVKRTSNGCHLCTWRKVPVSQAVTGFCRTKIRLGGRTDADRSGAMGKRTKVSSNESVGARDTGGFGSRVQQSAGADGTGVDGAGSVHGDGHGGCAAEEASEAGIAGSELFRRRLPVSPGTFHRKC